MFVLTEDSERTQGEDAQASNIAAAKAVAESVRTTLGPKGMDKMLVDDTGEVVITNDGVTILDEMDIEHPAAEMLVQVSEAQEDEVGDGTTTAAVLAGQLLAEAEDLIDDEVHPTTIVQGYAAARGIALETIEAETLGDETDDELLRKVAKSSMTGKGTGDIDAGRLAELVVEAIRHVETDEGVERGNVTVKAWTGASSSATELVEGVVIEDEPVRTEMPTTVEDATIAVFDDDLEPRSRDVTASVEYNVDSLDQLNEAIDAENEEMAGYAQGIIDAGVDVVFIRNHDMDDRVAERLAAAGVLVVENIDADPATALAQATGASYVADPEELDGDTVGHAEEVRVETYGDDTLVFVEGGADAETVTLFARGGTEHVSDELERAVTDALDVVAAAIDAGGVVPGAGAIEAKLAGAIRDEAAGVEGRQQLAVEAFADALDTIPRTLAENIGMDQIDALVDIRAGNEAGVAGVIMEGETGAIGDPIEEGVLDPAAVKREAVKSATEAATMIVRIDDVISANSD
ncbi:MAG: thermosome subunit alpha [Halobacteriaceae archaeon]